MPIKPNLFSPDWNQGLKQPKNKDADFEKSFFNNFQIIVNNKIYHFRLWNEEELNRMKDIIKNIKIILSEYAEKQKIHSYSRFPYDGIKISIKSLLNTFFDGNNLFVSSIGYDAKSEFDKLVAEQPKTPEEQQAKKERLLKLIDLDSIKDQGLKELQIQTAEIMSQPINENKLLEMVQDTEITIRKKIQKKITDQVFNEFFPKFKENKIKNQKWKIIKQLQICIQTIESRLEQIVS